MKSYAAGTEMPTKIPCNTCGIVKDRIPDGKIGGQMAFKDENGKRWSRRMCPPCYRIKQSKYNREVARPKDKVEKERVANRYNLYAAPGAKVRKCRGCSENTVNYYFCSGCYSRKKEKNSTALAEVEFFYG